MLARGMLSSFTVMLPSLNLKWDVPPLGTCQRLSLIEYRFRQNMHLVAVITIISIATHQYYSITSNGAPLERTGEQSSRAMLSQQVQPSAVGEVSPKDWCGCRRLPIRHVEA